MLSSSLKSTETKINKISAHKNISRIDKNLQLSLSVRVHSDLPFTKTSSLLQSKFETKLLNSNLHIR